jgi:hypothetical protein
LVLWVFCFSVSFSLKYSRCQGTIFQCSVSCTPSLCCRILRLNGSTDVWLNLKQNAEIANVWNPVLEVKNSVM